MACSLAESFLEGSYSASPVKTRGKADPPVLLLDDRIARDAHGDLTGRRPTCATLRPREPHRQPGPCVGHGVLPAVPADPRQARSADPSQGGRGGILSRVPQPRPRPRPARRAQGRGPRLSRVPLRPGQQPDRDDRRRLAHGLLRQALPLLALRRPVRLAARGQRPDLLQHAADHGDDVDGLLLSPAIQSAGCGRPVLGLVLPAQRRLLLRLLASARGLQHVLRGGLPVLRPAADGRVGPPRPPPIPGPGCSARRTSPSTSWSKTSSTSSWAATRAFWSTPPSPLWPCSSSSFPAADGGPRSAGCCSACSPPWPSTSWSSSPGTGKGVAASWATATSSPPSRRSSSWSPRSGRRGSSRWDTWAPAPSSARSSSPRSAP